jgi:polygalacturonase
MPINTLYPQAVLVPLPLSRQGLLMLAMMLLICSMESPAQGTAYVPPKLPFIPDKTFTVTEFGAIGDSTTDNAGFIQAAIDAAAKGGGGTVVIPPGMYLSGPLKMESSIYLRIDAYATLRMLPMERYPGGTKDPPNFIRGAKLHDVAIGGKGTIDGQGSPWWPFAKVEGAKRPRMIVLSTCDCVLIESLHLMNSPMFHIAVGSQSSNITVRGVTVRAPASDDPVNPSHNTDACNISGTHALVENCDISTGDDNFTCGGGTSNILIRNNTYGYGHGVSIGSPIKGGVSNITVEHCTFTNTECGIRIKSDRDRGSVVENLTYHDLQMTNVRFPILIYGAYAASEKKFRDLTKISPETAGEYPAATRTELTPVYRNISFKNITATTEPRRRAGLIWGLPEAPVTNLVMENVNITADLPFGIYNAADVRIENCKIVTPDGVNKIVTHNAQISITPPDQK